jgi:hypothetical protein
VDEPRLLRARRHEISRLLDIVAPTDKSSGDNALIIADPRSGRTSALEEVARGAEGERSRLVVRLRLTEEDLTSSGMMRALLTAAVEQLVAGAQDVPDWYLAWCDRVHLRDRAPMTLRDRLVSGLAFAGDAPATLDASTLTRDLRSVRSLAAERDYKGVVVCIDDAGPLLEDARLTEQLIDWLDNAGGWALLLASDPLGVSHLVEAVSPCLRTIERVPLMPFRTFESIYSSLTGPLEPESIERLMPKDELPLVLDLLRLTGGNPFEIALVAHHLWLACRVGEQEFYELTPRVLERVLHDLTVYTGAEAGLLDGARAIRRLAPEQIGPALDLVALARLTTRQVAIARALGVPNDSGTLNDTFLGCDLDEEERRVIEELEDLQRQGVVTLGEDGRFAVQGGQTAALALKYQARSQLGAEAAERQFDLPFFACVGEPLAEDYARRTRQRVRGASRLGWLALYNESASLGGARLRAVLSAAPFAGLETDVVPAAREAHDRAIELLVTPSDQKLVLVSLTLTIEGVDVDWLEVWETPAEVDLHRVNEALSDALTDWHPIVSSAGVAWRGSHAVIFEDEAARRALIQLMPDAAIAAVGQIFITWWEGEHEDGPVEALAIAEESVSAMRARSTPDWERGWESSNMLSRLGFLLSLFKERLDDARAALEKSREHGPADGWVTHWNLANVAARLGDWPEARRELGTVEKRIDGWTGHAYLTFFVPGRDARHSLVLLKEDTVRPLLSLQRAIIDHAATGDDPATQLSAVQERASEDEGLEAVSHWVADSLYPAVSS